MFGRRKFQEHSLETGTGFRRSASVLSFNHDGLEVARAKKSGRWLPVWHIIFFIYIGLLMRLVSMAEVGPAAYGNRMAELEKGNVIERMTAQIMYMDPVSRSIATNIRSGLRKIGSL